MPGARAEGSSGVLITLAKGDGPLPHRPTRGDLAMPLPYARAEVDDDGYCVVCPVCNQRCRPPAGAVDEDAATKGANAAYAAHYARAHA